MLPELYVFCFPGDLRRLIVRLGLATFSKSQALVFFESDRFKFWVRLLAFATLAVLCAGLFLVHLRLPSYPKYH